MRRFSDDAVARLRVSCSFSGGGGAASRASRSMRSWAMRCTIFVSVTRTVVGSAEERASVTESARRGKIELLSLLKTKKKNEIAVYRFNRKRLGRRPEPQQADIFAKRKLSTPGPVPIWQIQSGEYYVIDSPRFPALPHFRIR